METGGTVCYQCYFPSVHSQPLVPETARYDTPRLVEREVKTSDLICPGSRPDGRSLVPSALSPESH